MSGARESSGIPALDILLGGGLERRSITQFVGEPASGKTTVCLIAAVTCLRAGRAVVWIDSEGFSVERFRQVAGPGAETLAERLFLYEPSGFAQQGSMLLESDRTIKANKAGLVIVDSATALYRTELDRGRDAMQALTRQMLMLLGYAKRYDIIAAITNQAYMDPAKNMYRGLGGTALEHISKAIVCLERKPGLGERRATLLKHRSMPAGGTFDFSMADAGIVAEATPHDTL